MAQVLALDPPLPSRVIHQFPLPTWIENLAIRSNGQIVATNLTVPELWLIDPTTTPPKSILIHKFDNVSAATGVVEVGDDLFAVSTGNFDSRTLENEPGSYSIWSVDMSEFDKKGVADVKRVADIPESGFLNGMVLLEAQTKEILVADSKIGGVWKVDVGTGKYEMAIQVDEMKFPSQGLSIGVNGIKIRDGYLYWTNTGKSLFCRIKIDGDGQHAGEAEILDSSITGDDFVLDKQGNAWIAQPAQNTVTVLKTEGGKIVVAGKQDSLEVSGATACHFGKNGDTHMLYICTNGSLISPVNGKEVEGGKIAALDTSRFYA